MPDVLAYVRARLAEEAEQVALQLRVLDRMPERDAQAHAASVAQRYADRPDFDPSWRTG